MAKWLRNQVRPFITGNVSLLDLCGGWGSVMGHFNIPFTVVVDIYFPYLLKYQEERPDIHCVCSDVTNLSGLFSCPFDLITCLDGVEHLEKKGALKLLDWIDVHFKKLVLIFTPDIFVQNNSQEYIEKHWGIKGGAEYQTHKCCVHPDEFSKRGYDIIFKHKKTRDGVSYNQNLYVKRKENV